MNTHGTKLRKLLVMHFRFFRGERGYFLSSLTVFCVLAIASKASSQTLEPVPAWYRSCGQMVVVVTDHWESTEGQMRCLERGADKWVVKQDWIPVTVGRKGLGLGLGLHSGELRGPQKKEGDKRGPAGVFRLEFGFGTGGMASAAFPYRQTTDKDLWVDDPKSRFYNQWVNVTDPRVVRDWKSAETLRRTDGLYDYVIVVGHNREPILPGPGSAIFMHAWSAPGNPTIGCTAMEKARVKTLLQWLDASKAPVLVQAPGELLPTLEIPDEVMILMGK